MFGQVQPIAVFNALPKLHHFQIAGCAAELHFVEGGKMFLVNSNDHEIIIPMGTTVAGYYKGTWVSRKDQGADTTPDNCVPFIINDEADLISMNGKIIPVKAALEDLRKEDPTRVKLAYHDILDAPTPQDPSCVNILLKHKHLWKFDKTPVKSETGGDSKITQHHAAGIVSYEQWGTNVTCVAWSMRKSVKGLMPTRPFVITACDVKLPTQSALALV